MSRIGTSRLNGRSFHIDPDNTSGDLRAVEGKKPVAAVKVDQPLVLRQFEKSQRGGCEPVKDGLVHLREDGGRIEQFGAVRQLKGKHGTAVEFLEVQGRPGALRLKVILRAGLVKIEKYAGDPGIFRHLFRIHLEFASDNAGEGEQVQHDRRLFIRAADDTEIQRFRQRQIMFFPQQFQGLCVQFAMQFRLHLRAGADRFARLVLQAVPHAEFQSAPFPDRLALAGGAVMILSGRGYNGRDFARQTVCCPELFQRRLFRRQGAVAIFQIIGKSQRFAGSGFPFFIRKNAFRLRCRVFLLLIRFLHRFPCFSRDRLCP